MSEITTMKAGGAGAIPWNGTTKHYLQEVTLDFSETNVTTSDSVVVFEVKAKQLLLGMAVEVITPEGGAATGDFGFTGGDVDEFIDGANFNATAGTVVRSGDNTEDITAYGHYFEDADAIDLLPLTGNLDTAVIKVFAWFLDLS